MTTMNVTDVRKDLYNLINTVHDNHDTLLIKGKKIMLCFYLKVIGFPFKKLFT